MCSPLTKRTTDHSSLTEFLFSFFCDCCGKEWKTLPVSFNSGGFTAIEHEEVRLMIWTKEHNTAFEKANLEAHLYFNQCSKCGKRVCDACFNFEEARCNECCINL